MCTGSPSAAGFRDYFPTKALPAQAEESPWACSSCASFRDLDTLLPVDGVEGAGVGQEGRRDQRVPDQPLDHGLVRADGRLPANELPGEAADELVRPLELVLRIETRSRLGTCVDAVDWFIASRDTHFVSSYARHGGEGGLEAF